MKRESVQIGWLVLDEDREFTNHFETAAWQENVLVKAGKYPITVSKVGLMAGDEDIYALLPGTISSDYFPTLFVGSPVGGPYDSKQNAGKPGSHTICWRNYELAYNILKPKGVGRTGYKVELFPHVKAVYKEFTNADGKKATLPRVVFDARELEKMIDDPDSEVRRAVVKLGLGWDKLVRDPDTWVRVELARKGYGLDLLIQDSVWFVNRESVGYLKNHNLSLDEWIKRNPDKCALPENRVHRLDNVIKSCQTQADKQKKPEQAPGRNCNNLNLG